MQVFGEELSSRDIEIMELVDVALESNIYKIQAGIALARLGVGHQLAFMDYKENMEQVISLYNEISNPLVKEIVSFKIAMEMNYFYKKMEQLN